MLCVFRLTFFFSKEEKLNQESCIKFSNLTFYSLNEFLTQNSFYLFYRNFNLKYYHNVFSILLIWYRKSSE